MGYLSSKEIKNSLVVAFSKNICDKIIKELYNNRSALNDKNKYQIERKRNQIKKITQKYNISQESKLIEYATYGLATYYGVILPKEKMCIEELFEKRLIDTVVGTDAIAMGVNFPVENVVFAQLRKYDAPPISKNLFEQLAGRAGRKGYFDEGNVYYCDDFKGTQFKHNETKKLYEYLVEKANECVTVQLTPKIGNILKGKITIEEEAEFITRYSTETDEQLFEKSKDDIEQQLDIIINCNFIENEYNKKIDKLQNAYEKKIKGIDEDDPNHKRKLYELNYEMTLEEIKNKYNNDMQMFKMVKGEFDGQIANVYFDEYTAEQNCKIFIYILTGKSLEEIISISCRENLSDLLQLRKYLRSLPTQYRSLFNLDELDDKINSIDETVLDVTRDTLDIRNIRNGITSEIRDLQAQKNILNMMNPQRPKSILKQGEERT